MPLHLSIIVRDYFLSYPDKIIMKHWGTALFVVLIFSLSIYFYIKEIEFHADEIQYKLRRARVTEGDKILINLMRKPYAYMLQLMVSLTHTVAIMEIFIIAKNARS
jgi:hypothetical protein